MTVALLLRGDALAEFLSAFTHALVFVTGAFTLIACLAILVLHHHWSSFSAAMISFVGVAGALKGVSLIAPGFGAELTNAVLRAPLLLQGALYLELALGLWLCFVGWAREHVVFAFALHR